MRLYKPRPSLKQLHADNPSLFNGMVLPEGVNSSYVQGYILAECGGLDTIMETAADLAAYLPIWSAVHLDAWTRQAAALAAAYNPIHNYDRQDTEAELTTGAGHESAARTDSRNRNSAASQDESGSIGRTESGSTSETSGIIKGGSANRAESGSESETGSESGTTEKRGSSTSNSGFVGSTENSGEDTSTKGVQGFNSTSFQDSEQVVDEKGTRADSVSSTTNVAASEDGESSSRDNSTAKIHGSSSSETSSENSTEQHTGANLQSGSESSSRTSSAQEAQMEQSSGEENREHSREDSRTRSLHSAGNIGVTTTQQMITAEIDLRNKYNIYGVILNCFMREICVGVF